MGFFSEVARRRIQESIILGGLRKWPLIMGLREKSAINVCSRPPQFRLPYIPILRELTEIRYF